MTDTNDAKLFIFPAKHIIILHTLINNILDAVSVSPLSTVL